MKKAFLAMALVLALGAPALAAEMPVFRNVTVTAADGGPLTGSPGPVEKVKVRKLEWAGNMFTSNVKGRTWLFNPKTCVFTLPCGARVVPVYGVNALGETGWLIGVEPK